MRTEVATFLGVLINFLYIIFIHIKMCKIEKQQTSDERKLILLKMDVEGLIRKRNHKRVFPMGRSVTPIDFNETSNKINTNFNPIFL
jgi:hypothetical protein